MCVHDTSVHVCCLCTYECMHACIVCLCTYECACMHVLCVYVHMSVCMCVSVCTDHCTCMSMCHISMSVHACTSVCLCIHACGGVLFPSSGIMLTLASYNDLGVSPFSCVWGTCTVAVGVMTPRRGWIKGRSSLVDLTKQARPAPAPAGVCWAGPMAVLPKPH